ncbi:MAG TPA: hypothetical protein VLN49_15545 [Gemmatimonadaceae bacterium]|nr:hypothetical protein [Gemmatimonadaceae bacterium]
MMTDINATEVEVDTKGGVCRLRATLLKGCTKEIERRAVLVTIDRITLIQKLTMMRLWLIALAAGLAACSGELQPAPIGKELDLRQYLPDTLRTPATPPDSTFHQEMPVGPDSARVEMTWTSFPRGSGQFLGSVSARLVSPVKYDSLNLGHISDLKNSGSKERPVASARVQVAWFKRTFLFHRSGVMNFSFDAGGSRSIGPAAAR